MHARRRGMTMTELLTVVAVITILVAMMSPVLLRAQKEASRRACMGNLRHIYTGLELIRNKSFAKFPNCLEVSGNTVDEDSWWYRKVAQVIYPHGVAHDNKHYDHLTVPPRDDATWWGGAANAGINLQPFRPESTLLRCPASPDHPDDRVHGGGVPRNIGGVDKHRVFDDNYGYNNYGFDYTGASASRKVDLFTAKNRGLTTMYHDGGTGSITGHYNTTPTRKYTYVGDLAEFVGQASTILMMDYVKADIAPIIDDGYGFRFRHGGRANVMFADGRIEGYRVRRLMSEIVSDTIRWGVRVPGR